MDGDMDDGMGRRRRRLEGHVGGHAICKHVEKDHDSHDHRSLAEDDHHGERGAIAFVGDGYAVLGNETAVKGALNAVARGGAGFPDTTLGGQLGRIDPTAQAWMLVDVARMVAASL